MAKVRGQTTADEGGTAIAITSSSPLLLLLLSSSSFSAQYRPSMSDLLLHWLNHDLQLSTVVAHVERDMASGYLLGEILQRLNQQHNFSDFMNSAIADAKIINFCLLEPTLRRLHVKFDSKIATAIMNGTPGAAANVLYQIKMAAERLARAPPVSAKSEERRNARPLHNAPVTLAKPSYDAAHHYFFEHSVRRQVKSLGGLQRERDALAAEQQRTLAYREQQARVAVELERTKAERLHQAFLHSQYIKTALDETDSPAWRRALQKKRDRETAQAQFYQQLLTERQRTHAAHAFSLRHTVAHDLDAFDERRGTGSNGASRKLSHGYGLRSLSTALERDSTVRGPGLRDPSQPVTLSDPPSREHVGNAATIRDQRQHREKRREQLTRRRKRFVHDAIHAQTHANAGQMTRGLEQVVGRGTHREAESTHDMHKILVYKAIATENRTRRDESYATRRDMDLHDAMDRDTAAFELRFAAYNDDWTMQARHEQQRHIARTAAQQHEHTLVAGLVLHELIAFALVVAGTREDTAHARDGSGESFLLTDERWDELTFQFAEHGIGPLPLSLSQDDMAALVDHQFLQYLERFATPTFESGDYVGAVASGSRTSPWVPRDWKFVGAVEILEAGVVLGETVKYLRWLRHADPPALPAPSTPSILPQETEAIVSSLANGHDESSMPTSDADASTVLSPPSNVESATGDAVIEALQAACAADGDGGDPVASASPPVHADMEADTEADVEARPRLCIVLFGPPFAGKATQAKRLAETYDLALLSVEQQLQTLLSAASSTTSELALQIRTTLQRGEPVSPVLYSQLVLAAIQSLPPPHRQRWVLYDLPATRHHAQCLEEALTGFVEPTRVPSPFDLASRIAPGCTMPPLPNSFLHGASGVDLVFYFDCATSAALERCLGALEDCETHEQKHHLLFAPPPPDATDRHRLRHANASSNATPLLSLQCLATDDAAAEAKTYVARFDTLRTVATTDRAVGQSVAIARALTEDATTERLVAHVEALFAQQRAAHDEHQRDREVAETVAMQHEENRQHRLGELKRAILAAQDHVTQAQHAVQHAEETKAKKEELVELKNSVDAAKKLVERALLDARDWCVDESLSVRRAQSLYSARLLPSLACVLAGTWDEIERTYTRVMTQWLGTQRTVRTDVEQRAQWLVATTCRLLRRGDNKQRVVDAFQAQFNAVVDDMRLDDATKRELHARTDVLQDELLATTHTKHRESDDALGEMLSDGWLEHACQRSALSFHCALQAECDRFRGSLQLLLDAYLAASDEPAPLAGVADTLRVHQPPLLVELTLKAFVDASDDAAALAAAASAAAAATPAAAATAKGKPGATAAKGKPPPPLATAASTHAVVAPSEAVDPLAPETLLLAYDLVLHKADAVMQLLANAPPKHAGSATANEPAASAVPASAVTPAPTKTGAGKAAGASTPAATPTATPVTSMVLLPRTTIDVATSNFHKAVAFEHELLVRRVRFLQAAAQSAGEHMARAMRAVEATLRDAIEQRAAREEAAVAALVVHVRAAIEAETNLPFYINVQPAQVYRFPTTQHLLEDTRVTVDTRRRLVARAPDDPVPEIEPQNAVALNKRQAEELRRRLQVDELDETVHEAIPPVATMTIVEVVAVLRSLATEPHALPLQWQDADEATLAQTVAAFCDDEGVGFVDTRALVAAMETGTTLLPTIQLQKRVTEHEPTCESQAVVDHGEAETVATASGDHNDA